MKNKKREEKEKNGNIWITISILLLGFVIGSCAMSISSYKWGADLQNKNKTLNSDIESLKDINMGLENKIFSLEIENKVLKNVPKNTKYKIGDIVKVKFYDEETLEEKEYYEICKITSVERDYCRAIYSVIILNNKAKKDYIDESYIIKKVCKKNKVVKVEYYE